VGVINGGMLKEVASMSLAKIYRGMTGFMKLTLKFMVGLASVSLALVALPDVAQASKVITKVPTALRGTWYRKNSGWTDKYVFNKKSVKITTRLNGKVMDASNLKLTKKLKYSTKAKTALLQKQKRGWYGMSVNNANGICEIKRLTYKLNGKKYKVLFMQDMGGTGISPKKLKVGVAFHKNLKRGYTKKVSTKGMLQ